jgi:hypothetical protein
VKTKKKPIKRNHMMIINMNPMKQIWTQQNNNQFFLMPFIPDNLFKFHAKTLSSHFQVHQQQPFHQVSDGKTNHGKIVITQQTNCRLHQQQHFQF